MHQRLHDSGAQLVVTVPQVQAFGTPKEPGTAFRYLASNQCMPKGIAGTDFWNGCFAAWSP